MQKVIKNSKKTKKYLEKEGIDIANILDINIINSNQLRTQDTAKIISNELTENKEHDKLEKTEKSYLNIEQESSPMKKIFDKLNEYYAKDPDVIAI
jgi:phosphohistidine phosphatase SixA